MKKLLFITTRIFWPANSGRKVSLYYYCKGLHEKYGYDIYLYSFLEADQDKEECIKNKPNFIKEIKFAKKLKKTEIITNLFFKSFLGDTMPLQCSLMLSKSNEKRIKEYYKKHKFRVIITDMIRTAPYIKAFSNEDCVKILDMDDLLSKRYRRTLKNDNSGENFLGQFSKFLPGFVNKYVVPKVKKIVLKSEIKRLDSAEASYSKQYDHVIFVSENETKELNKRLGFFKCVTVTLGVDYDYFSEEIQVDKNNNYIAFVGNFGYTPNIDSLKIIINNILPGLPSEVKLLAVGKAPKELIESLQSNNVEFTGMVEDIRLYVKQCSVFLSPISYGSGIKTKILEAMAMGLPVVTNSIGAEGISAENGYEIVVVDNYKEMIKAVNKLLSDKEYARKVGEAGQRYVRTHHLWDSVLQGFDELVP
ncbi:glycosyltransferase family 4 protein [Ruminococcus flavefaciens]|uniref:glycosyltransferase family 4 protein n=1 Tax=Ruminococcus flavefaciens TaxID=1265 RepID=UPI0004671CF1|nr:glycosyltransferase family 4 protein [Ruminococcus flavefaciens]